MTTVPSLKTQLIRFIIVGVIAAVVDIGSTMVCDYFLGIDRVIAKIIGWILGTTTAYVFNSRWTFTAKTSTKLGVAVAILYLSTLGVQTFLYWALASPLNAMGLSIFWRDMGAFVIAQGVATVTNFVVQRLFIFKTR